MILKFVKAYEANKSQLQRTFAKRHPAGYRDIVKAVASIIPRLDPKHVHEIGDREYHGNLLYLIAENIDQPRKYWYVLLNYGSCSGCDTLQRIRDYSHSLPTEEQVKDYMTLALHIVQGLKALPIAQLPIDEA